MVTDFEFNSLNDILYFYGIDEKASMLFTETDDTVDIMDEYLEELNLDPGLDTVEEFHVFYDTVDEQLKGILTYDTRKLDEVSDLVFASRYVPVDAVWWDNLERPDIGEIYASELAAINALAARSKKDALIIVGHIGMFLKGYIASEKETVGILGYKTYNNHFSVVYEDGRRTKDAEQHYAVYIPSRFFRDLTGLIIIDDMLELRTPDEPWVERPPYVPSDLTVKYFRTACFSEREVSVWEAGVVAVNNCRRFNLGNDHLYYSLEKRMLRIERLAMDFALSTIVKNELRIVENTLKTLDIF